MLFSFDDLHFTDPRLFLTVKMNLLRFQVDIIDDWRNTIGDGHRAQWSVDCLVFDDFLVGRESIRREDRSASLLLPFSASLVRSDSIGECDDSFHVGAKWVDEWLERDRAENESERWFCFDRDGDLLNIEFDVRFGLLSFINDQHLIFLVQFFHLFLDIDFQLLKICFSDRVNRLSDLVDRLTNTDWSKWGILTFRMDLSIASIWKRRRTLFWRFYVSWSKFESVRFSEIHSLSPPELPKTKQRRRLDTFLLRLTR